MTLPEYSAAWLRSHDKLMLELKTLFDRHWLDVLEETFNYEDYAALQSDLYRQHVAEADRLWREYNG